jgi:AmmeMemoRadiSam system protein B
MFIYSFFIFHFFSFEGVNNIFNFALSLENKVTEQNINEKYLISAILDKSFYKNPVLYANNTVEKVDTNLVIVNHHLLAPHFIANTLAKVKSENVENIILLSPNHFYSGKSDIIYSNLKWKTPFGFLNPIKFKNDLFLKNLPISLNNHLIGKEHGISGLIGFLHLQFPKAKILPIMQKESMNKENSILLGKNITKYFNKKNTLVVMSIDMSHDLDPYISNFHDILTKEVLNFIDIKSINRLDIDSKAGFYTAFTIAKNWGDINFNEVNYSSSAKLLNKKFQPDTTSYITGYFTKFKNTCSIENDINCMNALQKKSKVTTLFLGDMMLDRYIRQSLDKNGFEYLLDDRIKRFMNGSDVTVVNFESAMTNFKHHKAYDNMLRFTSDPKWAKKMYEYGINFVSLANNHSLNFGKEGLTQTRKFLKDENILSFGSPLNNENISIIKNIRGIKIGFIGYNEFYGNFSFIIDEIKKLKVKADFIVVSSHWGDEYLQKIQQRPQKKARLFIDAGADLVIGHHPHVVQPMEIYKDKYIFYSVGNFLFDQIVTKSVRERLGLGITFSCTNHCKEKKIDYIGIPLITNKKYQVRIMNELEYKKFSQKFPEIMGNYK